MDILPTFGIFGTTSMELNLNFKAIKCFLSDVSY
jgi:hypothetical protein